MDDTPLGTDEASFEVGNSGVEKRHLLPLQLCDLTSPLLHSATQPALLLSKSP